MIVQNVNVCKILHSCGSHWFVLGILGNCDACLLVQLLLCGWEFTYITTICIRLCLSSSDMLNVLPCCADLYRRRGRSEESTSRKRSEFHRESWWNSRCAIPGELCATYLLVFKNGSRNILVTWWRQTTYVPQSSIVMLCIKQVSQYDYGELRYITLTIVNNWLFYLWHF